MGAKVNFDHLTKIIEVTQVPLLIGGELTVELDIKTDIYSDGKEDWLASSDLSRLRFPLRAVGGDTLPGGKTLGSTFFLDSSWKIKPYEASHRFRVNGNFFSEDGTSPFIPTDGAYNIILEATVSNLVDSVQRQLPEVTQIKYMIESARQTHQGFGVTFFVDAIHGDDLQTGATPDKAKQTITSALNATVSGRGDVIYLIASDTGVLLFDENIVISKEDVHIRGPGRGARINPNAGVPITINADNCSLSGFVVQNSGDNADCISIAANATKLEKLTVIGAGQGVGTGRGVVVRGGEYHEFINLEVERCGGSGLVFRDYGLTQEAPRESIVNGALIYQNGGNSIDFISLSGAPYTSTRQIIVHGAYAHRNTGYGVFIDSNTAGVILAATCRFNGNILGDISNNGVNTDTALLGNQIWEHKTGNEAAGTQGKRLKDIKTFSNILVSK